MFYASNIRIKINRKIIVRNSSLKVDDGQVAIYIGSNGSGKTTTLKGISGLLPLAEGESSLLTGSRVKDFGISLGPEYLPLKITARKYISMNRENAMQDTDRFSELYKGSGLSDLGNKRLGSLSSGMKQKLSIINALRFQPKNIILDEPHNGLDPQSIEWLNQEIHYLKNQGSSILVSSHLLREVSNIGDIAYKIEESVISSTNWPPYKSSSSYVVTCNKIDEVCMSLMGKSVEFKNISDNQVLIKMESHQIFHLLNSLGVTVADFKEAK